MTQIVIRIIYDNRKENPQMQEGWGFSCFIEVDHRKILFDTGADVTAFFANLKQVGIALTEISDICFSHRHADHVAGLEEVLSHMKKETRLFVPKGFPKPQCSIQVIYVSDFT